MELHGKVMLVTGAARRVGRAIAVRLAGDGCRVAVHYRSSAEDAARTVEACEAAGAQAFAICADLANASAANTLVAEVLDRWGRLDGLVNNASTFEHMTVGTFDLEKWDQTLRINTTAPLLLTLAAREALRQARGRVVNISDVAVSRPWPDHLAYMVSKGALDTLTRVLARALAPDVTVVGVAPGVAEWPPHYDDQTRARLTARIPLQRAGTPADIANMVHYLMDKGDYISGAIIPIDGGRHVV